MSARLRSLIADYLSSHHGSLLASGAYIASDASNDEEQQWLANYLKTALNGTNLDQSEELITGLGRSFTIYRQLNEHHYAAWHLDVVRPVGAAFGAMQYADGRLAAIAYKGNEYRTFTMAFPFECIKDAKMRDTLMQGILNFLISNTNTSKR